MSSINIQTADGLLEIGGNVTREKIESVLGYSPADSANLPNISDDGSGELSVADSNGNIVASVDATGIHSTDVTVGGVSTKEHLANSDVHITAEERKKWDIKSDFSGDYNDLTNLPNISDDGSGELSVADSNGNIVASVDATGIHSISVSVDAATIGGVDAVTAFGELDSTSASLSAHLSDTEIHVTASDKSKWDAKSDFSGSYNDLTDAPNISEDGSGDVVISDAEGNLIARVDSSGVETTSVVAATVVAGRTDVGEAIAGIVEDISGHKADTVAHITDAERSAWNAKSDFSGSYNDLTDTPNILDDESAEFSVSDTSGNIIFKVDGSGAHATTLDADFIVLAGEDIAEKVSQHISKTDSAISDIVSGATKVASAANADKATTATSATSATKATQDASGNVITSTYETKKDAASKLSEAKSYSDANLVSAKGYSDTNLTAAKEYSDANLATAKSYADSIASSKSDSSHTHDDRYYTETEVDTLLSGKSDTGHNHDPAYDAKGSADAALASAKSYTDSKVSSLTTSSAIDDKISVHDTSTTAHSDIRTLISGLTTRLNALADSDDTTLDQLSEVVAYIRSNRSLIEGITTSKVNVSDIVDNLTTSSSSKVLSAAQGVAIKSLINTLQSELNSHTHEIGDVAGLQSALDSKAASSHGTHVSYSATAPVMDGSASAGTASTVARSDHKHPTDTSRAAKDEFDSLVDKFEGHTHTSGDITDLQGTIDTINSTISNKMDSVNPTGSGNVSIGRKSGSTVGSPSVAIGANVEASGDSSVAIGAGGAATGENSVSIGSHNNALNEYALSTGCWTTADGPAAVTIGNASKSHGWASVAGGILTEANGQSQVVLGSYNIPDSAPEDDLGKAEHLIIVGNGDIDTGNAKSNAHTLDWDGNAWFAGDVYVGSTSGTNKDSGSKKLITVDEASTLAAESAAGKADVSHVHATSDVTGLQSVLDSKMAGAPTCIEMNSGGSLKGFGGFIDFHFHNSDGKPTDASGTIISSAPDYTSRIIEDAAGTISVNGVKMKSGTITGTLDGNAASATQDADGNIITSTYETKTGASSKLEDAKVYTDTKVADLASKSYVDNLINGLTTEGTADAALVAASLNEHKSDTTAHITATERANWNKGYTHSQAAHAPSDAEKNQNAFSNITVGSTTISADITTDTVSLAGSNVTITPDATNDKITFSVADGSTSAKGVVQLTDSTSSTSTTTAATPSSVKAAYDLANSAKSVADGKANSSHTHTVASITDLTATATELNYMDGVTSNVQTQLNGKSASGHTHTIAADASDDDVVVLSGTSGTNGVTYSATHATSGVTAGTYKSVTVNKYGHITSGSNPTTLSGYGITDAATKTELASKQATITGGASTIASNDLTTSRALVSNASGKVTVSDVTSTELSYLDGATGNIQSQLNNKADKSTTYTKTEVDSLIGGLSSEGTADANAVLVQLNTHKGDTSNPHQVTKAQLGLGNVDNTSDADKPISTATKSALDGKANLDHTHADYVKNLSVSDNYINFTTGNGGTGLCQIHPFMASTLETPDRDVIGLYKVAVGETGHIEDFRYVSKTDITDLGVADAEHSHSYSDIDNAPDISSTGESYLSVSDASDNVVFKVDESGIHANAVSAEQITVGGMDMSASLSDIRGILTHGVPVSNGGTGATTANDAVTNLGAVHVSGDTMSGDLSMGDNSITRTDGIWMNNNTGLYSYSNDSTDTGMWLIGMNSQNVIGIGGAGTDGATDAIVKINSAGYSHYIPGVEGAIPIWSLLWENSSPTSNFSSQTITVEGLSEYDLFIGIADYSNSSDWTGYTCPVSFIYSPDGAWAGGAFSAVYPYSGSTNQRYRSWEVTPSENTVKFNTAYYSGSTSSAVCIPRYIFGVKLDNSFTDVSGQAILSAEGVKFG